jgi:DNA-directed RNA polymerase specialized sigma24 family protein
MSKPYHPENGLDWALQSASVDDLSLAQALVEAYFVDLYAFAFRLADGHPRALHWSVQAIASAIRLRHRISIESSLRAWLFARIPQEQASRPGWLRRLRQHIDSISLRSQQSQTGLAQLDRTESLLLALHYNYGFTEAESGTILSVPEQGIREALMYARLAAYRALYPEDDLDAEHLPFLAGLYAENGEDGSGSQECQEHRQSCPLCQAYEARQAKMRAVLAAEYGVRPVVDLQAVHQQVIQAAGLNINGGAKRSRSYWKEMALVGALVGGMLYFGQAQQVFTPFDARPTITFTASPAPPATATPRPQLVFPGVENEDYFFYQYSNYEGESLESIAGWSGMRMEEILTLNDIDPGRSSNLFDDITLVAFRESGWFDPPPSNTRLVLPPLNERSSPAEVLERMLHTSDFWQTLWSDTIFINHGMPGFIQRPIEHMRLQTWVSGKELMFLTAAPQSEIEAFNFSATKARGLMFSNFEGESRAARDSSLGLFSPLSLVQDEAFSNLLSSAALEVGGKRQIAGREALGLKTITQEYGKLRFWVDTQTGLPLGIQVYASIESEAVQGELMTNALVINPRFPPDLFFPPANLITELSASYRGEPLRENTQALPIDWDVFVLTTPIDERIPPPDDFDLASSRLTFQKLEEQEGIDVFAGEYFLGALDIAQANIRQCRRSPDGRYAAFMAMPPGLFSEDGSLYLLDLESFSWDQVPNRIYGIPSFSFSPSSTKLVYWTCWNQCRLEVYDLASGENSQLVHSTGIHNTSSRIIFSPDETQIAILEPAENQLSRLAVFDLENGELLFRGAFDWEKARVTSPGSPTDEWGVPFPPPVEPEGC